MPYARLNATIGRRLGEVRLRAGVSREAVAERMGVAPNELASWEIGETRISASDLFGFSVAVGCSVEEIYAAPQGEGESAEASRVERSDLR